MFTTNELQKRIFDIYWSFKFINYVPLFTFNLINPLEAL